jgi:hypothetical protein
VNGAPDDSPGELAPRVDLYWIPLGAGGHFVAWNGRVFEALSATFGHRPRADLYHSALTVTVPDGRYTIELTPVPGRRQASRSGGAGRGVTVQGPVGLANAGRLRLFRYEVRCWRGGVIPDLRYAIGHPRLVSGDESTAERILDLTRQVPALIWGRDQSRAGEMWNSNSVISWLLERAGLDASAMGPPGQARAPGWRAGIVVAQRQPLPQHR